MIDPPTVPPFFTFIVQVVVVQLTELETIDNVAGLALVPKMPKTNVAMATAAMRVMAISITVARTGLMAWRFEGLGILNWSTY